MDHAVTRRNFVSRLNVVSTLDAQFFDLGVQSGSFQTEALRRAIGAADHSLALPQDAKNVFAFRSLKICIGRSGRFFDGFEFCEWGAQHRPGRENDGPFDKILEFAHVARPVPFDESIHRLARNRFDMPAHALRMAGEKIADEKRNVLATLAKWRNRDGENAKPVVQVAAELSGVDHLSQVAICGGHETNIYGNRSGASDPFEFLFL